MTNTTSPAKNIPYRWYDLKAIAVSLSVSVNTVRSWQQRNQMPQADIREHKFTRWKAETIEPFLEDPIRWRRDNETVKNTKSR